MKKKQSQMTTCSTELEHFQVLEPSSHAFLYHNRYWQIMVGCQSVFGEVVKKFH